jgi:hypothetical protein
VLKEEVLQEHLEIQEQQGLVEQAALEIRAILEEVEEVVLEDFRTGGIILIGLEEILLQLVGQQVVV